MEAIIFNKHRFPEKGKSNHWQSQSAHNNGRSPINDLTKASHVLFKLFTADHL